MEVKESKTTVKQLFINRIVTAIIKGELKPGDRLPSEREMAADANISKSAVHLAVAELERLGFVETNLRKGIYVGDFAKKGNIDTLNLLITMNGDQLASDMVEDMLEMRMAIEGKALEQLAQTLNDEKIALLEADIQATKEVDPEDPGAIASSLFKFHHDIMTCSENFILPLIFNSFELMTTVYWEQAVRRFGREKCLELMEGLVEKIRLRDADESCAYLRAEFQLFLNRVNH